MKKITYWRIGIIHFLNESIKKKKSPTKNTIIVMNTGEREKNNPWRSNMMQKNREKNGTFCKIY